MVSRAELRHGSEWLDLFVAVLVTVLIVGFLSIFTSGFVCLWAVIVIVIAVIISAVTNSGTKKYAALVTADSFPKIYKKCQTAAERLGMKAPPVYLDGSSEVNAYARGIVSPMIVLHQGLVRRLDDDELLFVIGHEMGHVKLNHTALKTIFDSGMHRVPLLLYLPLLIFRLMFLHGRMSRSMEHSADRAGLYACGDIETAVSAQLKLERVSVSRSDVRKAIMHMGSAGDDSHVFDLLRTHPKKAKRIRELVLYSATQKVGWKKGL